MSAIRKIKHEARGRDGNKARGKAECFITIKAKRQVFYTLLNHVGDVILSTDVPIKYYKCFNKQQYIRMVNRYIMVYKLQIN